MIDHGTTYILLACAFGLLMTWGVGANDLANVMSTTMCSKSISIRQAIIIAIIFEFAGAYLGGAQVSATVRNGIINTAMLANDPQVLIYGMLAVLLAGSTWIGFASYMGLPVSITHTLIGALVGFGAIRLGTSAVQWNQVAKIGLSWLTSPLIAGFIAYVLIIFIQRLIFTRVNPDLKARKFAPLFLFLTGLAFAWASVLRGLEHHGIEFSTLFKANLCIAIGIGTAILGSILLRRIPSPNTSSRHSSFTNAEEVFGVLMIFTACAMVFAHGSNDIAIAVGPMAAAVGIVQSGGATDFGNAIPMWITFLGCLGVIVGFFMYGRNVIATVGQKITGLTPSRAFAATLSAAFTVVLATGTGIPVSATQTLVGAILGVGLARGIGALNLTVIRHIFMSWIITIPAGATLAIIYFNLISKAFGLL